jgi:hypothetical protein
VHCAGLPNLVRLSLFISSNEIQYLILLYCIFPLLSWPVALKVFSLHYNKIFSDRKYS